MVGISSAFAAGALLCLAAWPAQAAGNKLWVAAEGADTGVCSFAAPCLTFQYAQDQSNDGAEIDVKDSGSYGPVIITKSISIVANGVDAVVGVNAATGFAIKDSAGPSGIVTLRGLSVSTHNKADGSVAITNQSNGHLVIDHTVVSDSNYGIASESEGFVIVTNSLITNNGNGLYNEYGYPFYIGSNTISSNVVGLRGAMTTYGDNHINGNTSCDTCQATLTTASPE